MLAVQQALAQLLSERSGWLPYTGLVALVVGGRRGGAQAKHSSHPPPSPSAVVGYSSLVQKSLEGVPQV